jgi:hypothetical protein
MTLMARSQEVHSGGPDQPLARDDQCHLISSIDLGNCPLGGLGGDDAIVGREPPGEVALDGGEDVLIAIDGEQYRVAHAGYPVPDLFTAPFRPGSRTRVSSLDDGVTSWI